MNEWRNLPTIQDVAAAMTAKDEIQISSAYEWIPWTGDYWRKDRNFRARPFQPKTKSIKMLCWFDGTSLIWRAEDQPLGLNYWVRIPSEDKKIEVLK